MNKLQKNIIKLLKEDARYGYAKIATMLGCDEDTVKEAVTELESKGIIVKYTAIINNEKTGEEFGDALIEVRVTPQARRGFDAIAEKIYKFDDVKAVFLMSGTYDLAITLECKTAKDVALFVSERLSAIDGVVGTSTHFIMKKYKDGGVIFEDDESSKRLSVSE